MKEVNSRTQGRENGLSIHRRRHLDKVYGVLQEGLADGTDIRRELGGARRYAVPVQPTQDPTQSHIVCIFSRLLTKVDSRYSKAEKEALGVFWLVKELKCT
jgi:hypothetical protein